MTIAEIHGKLRADYCEDLLTADVFGAFKYLPADVGIIGFLRSEVGLDEWLPPPDDSASCEFHFWPSGTRRNREPDVLIEVQVNERIYHIVVEAKYGSPPGDWQLGHEYEDLRNGGYDFYRHGCRDSHEKLTSSAEDRALLYVTAHSTQPDADMDYAIRQCPDLTGKLYWTSWYHVYDYMDDLDKAENLDRPYRRVVEDILTLLEYKSFARFSGIRRQPLNPLPSIFDEGGFWKGKFPGITRLPVIELPTTTGSGLFWNVGKESS